MTEQLAIRKMLELAAKSAGINGYYDDAAGKFRRIDSDGRHIEWWIPEHDDGDSKRLAVKLRIGVEMWELDAYAEWYDDKNFAHCAVFDSHGGDADKAWRYAVLSVAAQIGASMP